MSHISRNVEPGYVSLEDLDKREFAEADPRGGLNQLTEGAILDEAQRSPLEIKSGQTITTDYFKGLEFWKSLAGDNVGHRMTSTSMSQAFFIFTR